MPISVDDFKGLKGVEEFLKENQGKAFTQKELRNALDLTKSTVSYQVNKLLDEGKIQSKRVGRNVYVVWHDSD